MTSANHSHQPSRPSENASAAPPSWSRSGPNADSRQTGRRSIPAHTIKKANKNAAGDASGRCHKEVMKKILSCRMSAILQYHNIISCTPFYSAFLYTVPFISASICSPSTIPIKRPAISCEIRFLPTSSEICVFIAPGDRPNIVDSL